MRFRRLSTTSIKIMATKAHKNCSESISIFLSFFKVKWSHLLVCAPGPSRVDDAQSPYGLVTPHRYLAVQHFGYRIDHCGNTTNVTKLFYCVAHLLKSIVVCLHAKLAFSYNASSQGITFKSFLGSATV
jgi:hypothetical protein